MGRHAERRELNRLITKVIDEKADALEALIEEHGLGLEVHRDDGYIIVKIDILKGIYGEDEDEDEDE